MSIIGGAGLFSELSALICGKQVCRLQYHQTPPTKCHALEERKTLFEHLSISNESSFFPWSIMSCVDVMYQPYATYFPYQRPAPSAEQFKKFGVSKMQDSIDSGGYSSSAALSSSASASVVTKAEDMTTSPEKECQPQDAHYLSANCVIFTYFSGDIAANVDEHFTRALNQPSSYSAESQASKATSWKDMLPMSQRNFPASFWNSNYQPPVSLSGSHKDFFATDPYMTSSLHTVPSLHQDPWHYSLTSQAHTYTHRSMHDFAYPSMASTSRFNPQYSSLLPTGRLGAVAGQCDVSKPGDSWSGRYHSDPLGSSLSTHAHSHLDAAYSGPMKRAHCGTRLQVGTLLQ